MKPACKPYEKPILISGHCDAYSCLCQLIASLLFFKHLSPHKYGSEPVKMGGSGGGGVAHIYIYIKIYYVILY